MKNIIIILFFSNILYCQTISLDTNFLLIGEQTKLTVSNVIQDSMLWPDIEKILSKEIEIIKKGDIDTLQNKISQEFILTVWDSGTYYIPSINFSKNIQSEKIILNVKTININKDDQLKDIKDPFGAPLSWQEIWPWILIIIILFTTIFLIRKYISNKKKLVTNNLPEKITPCHIIALNELNMLEKKQLWENGFVKDYYSEISEILRRYLEKRFQFIALEITTEEIIKELNNKIKNITLEEVSILLKRADLAKFAKSKPNKSDNIESLSMAKKIIEKTKQDTKE